MFALKRFWFDGDNPTEMVEVHYTWTPLGGQPDWNKHEETRALALVPGTVPALRLGAIDLPEEIEGSPTYTLHSFFLVIHKDGRQEVTPVLAEEIAPREVTYEDPAGTFTSVGLHWSAFDWSAPNYTLMMLEGLPPEVQSPRPGIRYPEIFEFVQGLPLPRRFRGRVWGPRGATIHAAYHLLRVGSPDPKDDLETWDNNAGRNYALEI